MKTTHRFSLPHSAEQTVLEMPMEFDLHVSKGDYVTFESIPYKVFVITKKTFMVLFDNTIDHVDYVVEEG